MTTKEKQAKIRKVMKEYKSGTLKSSSGEKVKSRSQAIAIALQQAGMSKKDKSDAYWDSYIDSMCMGEEEEGEEEEMEDSLGKN
jgi:hypothetical protein